LGRCFPPASASWCRNSGGRTRTASRPRKSFNHKGHEGTRSQNLKARTTTNVRKSDHPDLGVATLFADRFLSDSSLCSFVSFVVSFVSSQQANQAADNKPCSRRFSAPHRGTSSRNPSRWLVNKLASCNSSSLDSAAALP
jgi:hypothetical protein